MRRVDYMVGARDFKGLKAEQFMQDAVFYYSTAHTGEQVAREMTAGEFGSVPVVNSERKLVGIVTEFDLLRTIMEDKPLSDIKVGEMMTPNPVTVAPETSAVDLVRLLQDKHLIRMPVVDDTGKLLGIVARRDILVGYLKATTHPKGFWP
jgi:CBS domain-containing protein